MAAQFYFDPTAVNTTTAKVSSASGAAAVILPAGAIITEIQFNAAATGGVAGLDKDVPVSKKAQKKWTSSNQMFRRGKPNA
jgi:hypothetical protein